MTDNFDQTVGFLDKQLTKLKIYKDVLWFIKRGVIVGETLVWWKGLAKELELDIESLDERTDENRL